MPDNSFAWIVSHVEDAVSRISPLCALSSVANEAGNSVRLVNRFSGKKRSYPSRGEALLVFKVSIPSSPPNGTVPVEVSVQGQSSWDAKGVWHKTAKGGILTTFVSSSIDDVLPAIARGKVLRVAFAGIDLDFSLKGSYAAIPVYEKCLSEVQWVTP